ncbi:8306_t:CDS:2, partial [Gigaspora margarita]
PIEEDNDNNLNNTNNEEQEYEKTMFELFDIDNNLPELRSSGMTYINNDHVSEQDHLLKLLEKMIQETTNHNQDFSQYPTEKLVDMTFSEDPNTDSDEDEENENENNYKFNDDERFTILNSNK